MKVSAAGDMGSIPGSRRSPGKPSPVFLPGESCGQELGGLWSVGLQEPDTTEVA